MHTPHMRHHRCGYPTASTVIAFLASFCICGSFPHLRGSHLRTPIADAVMTAFYNFCCHLKFPFFPTTTRNYLEAPRTSTKGINKWHTTIQTCTNLQNTSNNIESTKTHWIQAEVSKIFRITLLIKKYTKAYLNDLKFCTHILNDTMELLRLPKFHSDPYIKISPINQKTPKIQFCQFKPKSTPDLPITLLSPKSPPGAIRTIETHIRAL